MTGAVLSNDLFSFVQIRRFCILPKNVNAMEDFVIFLVKLKKHVTTYFNDVNMMCTDLSNFDELINCHGVLKQILVLKSLCLSNV